MFQYVLCHFLISHSGECDSNIIKKYYFYWLVYIKNYKYNLIWFTKKASKMSKLACSKGIVIYKHRVKNLLHFDNRDDVKVLSKAKVILTI